MKVYSDYKVYEKQQTKLAPLAVAIGNFDGCHKGHQMLLKHISEMASSFGGRSLVFSFAPHPRVFFGSLHKNDLLFTSDLKNRSIESYGVDFHLAQEFSESFRNITPEFFVREILIKSLNAKYVVVGDNFKFGRERSGNSSWLKRSLEAHGAQCKVFSDVISCNSKPISSTMIREQIKNGDVKGASFLLGHPYFIRGVVTAGQSLGKGLGFPTANLRDPAQLTPKPGVYFCRVTLARDSAKQSDPSKVSSLKSQSIPAIVNCGYRPTVSSDQHITLEAHILADVAEPLNGKTLEIHFLDFLREERKFKDMDALKTQIGHDVDAAKKYFNL